MKWPAVFVFFDNTKKYAWWVPVIMLVYWLYDRTDNPSEQIGLPVAQLVVAGEDVTFQVPIKRDLKRECSATAYRYMLDSNGARSSIGDLQEYTRDSIVRLEQVSPGMSRFKFTMPKTTPSGPATLFTNLKYKCLTNPLTLIWPIEVTREWTFYVLPVKGTL